MGDDLVLALVFTEPNLNLARLSANAPNSSQIEILFDHASPGYTLWDRKEARVPLSRLCFGESLSEMEQVRHLFMLEGKRVEFS